MKNWKYTDATSSVVVNLNTDGSNESCLVSAIADWIAEGNTPAPADVVIVDPKLAISDEIATLERNAMLPRVTREFMLLFMQSQGTPDQLAAMPAYVKVKALDTQIALLRSQLV